MGDWDEQFEKSLARFRRESSGVADPRSIAHVVASAMNGLKRAEMFAGDALRQLMSASESPIEEALCAALCLVAAHEQDYCDAFVKIPGDDPEAAWMLLPKFEKFRADFTPACGIPYAAKPDRILIEPQAKIGPYRVDFLVRDGGVDEHRSVAAVIECDGHEFHARTKTQVATDRERDRYVQQKGYLALRYPGSDIFADPLRCAQDVFSVLGSRLSDIAAGSSPARKKARAKPRKKAAATSSYAPHQEWHEPCLPERIVPLGPSGSELAALAAVARLPLDQQESWGCIVAAVECASLAAASCLRHARPIEVAPGALRIGFPAGSFFARQLRSPAGSTHVANAAMSVLGAPTVVTLVDVSDERPLTAEAS